MNALRWVGLLLVPGLLAAEAVSSPRPNVLFIAIDDLRTNIGVYGDPCAITPNIDHLARRGIRFTHAYAQQAVCSPSRSSLMTGRRPDTIRVWDLKTHFRKTAPGVVTLPQYFREHGYFAQAFGKIFHGERPMADPESWSVPEQFEYIDKREDYRLEMNRGGGRMTKAAATEFVDAPDNAYPDGKISEAAVAALEERASHPEQSFFLAVGFLKPHLPFTAPKRYWDMNEKVSPLTQAEPPSGAPAVALHNSAELRGYTDIPDHGPIGPDDVARLRRGYYAATTFTDAQVGHVLDALERTGLAKNTIVILWSDHGFHLGEQGLWAKTTNYEADTRVPLIVARPGEKKPDSESPALVELLDMYPTLVELCGLPAAAGLEGTSLVPWLDDPQHPSRKAAFSQFPRPWIYRGAPQVMGYTVRTAHQRYVEWRKFGTNEVVARELYDYAPGQQFETENLADKPEEAARLAELAALLPHSK